MMSRRHQQILNVILIDGLHSLDTSAAAVLCFEIIYGHTFDITETGHGNNSIFPRNQILHGDIQFVITDLTASVIAVFFSDSTHFCLNNT